MDNVFKALANPTRRKLLDRLCTPTTGRLWKGVVRHLGNRMTRQAVTKHLVLLEEANLVVTVRK